MSGPRSVYLAKGSRVFVSGLMSVMIPVYLNSMGYGPFFIGVALAAILAGNAASNIVLSYLVQRTGSRKLLQAFSLLMLGSGLLLAASTQPIPILLACFLGNVSTTGTEAGPFQSVEAGVLPELVAEGSAVKAFGRYNLIGYTASAFGTSALSVPGYLGSSLPVFRTLFIGFGVVGLLLFTIYTRLRFPTRKYIHESGPSPLGPEARRDVTRLSGLFSVDAFGGSFVSQYLLSYWFTVVYGVPVSGLAAIFLFSNLISGASTYGAAVVAERLGNLRTMVYTHIPSSILLILIPFAGTLTAAVVLLFLRQSLSQMDVPTRQALMTEMFKESERVPAYAITNTVRSVGAFAAGPVSAGLLVLGLPSALLYLGGATKIGYDLSTYVVYRKRFR
ncbi:MAG: MFS transporter [Thaumarchaeota archaeon]|nr:MFS transporter [Nitrososphaerota archaeon]